MFLEKVGVIYSPAESENLKSLRRLLFEQIHKTKSCIVLSIYSVSRSKSTNITSVFVSQLANNREVFCNVNNLAVKQTTD